MEWILDACDAFVKSDKFNYDKLVNIYDFQNGKGHEKEISEKGKYIVVNSKFVSTNGEIKKFCNSQICQLIKDDICIVMSDLPNGRALAKCYIINENNKYTLNQRIGGLRNKNFKKYNNKFFFYVLNRNKQLLKYDNGVDQTNLKKEDILNIMFPMPPINVQEKIVSVLDRFEKLCNDLTEGLPAEIEARKKQYEYYRDKLLTF